MNVDEKKGRAPRIPHYCKGGCGRETGSVKRSWCPKCRPLNARGSGGGWNRKYECPYSDEKLRELYHAKKMSCGDIWRLYCEDTGVPFKRKFGLNVVWLWLIAAGIPTRRNTQAIRLAAEATRNKPTDELKNAYQQLSEARKHLNEIIQKQKIEKERIARQSTPLPGEASTPIK